MSQSPKSSNGAAPIFPAGSQAISVEAGRPPVQVSGDDPATGRPPYNGANGPMSDQQQQER